VLFQDIPNLATETMPAGYKFGYMQPNQGFDRLIKRVWPEVRLSVQPLGVVPGDGLCSEIERERAGTPVPRPPRLAFLRRLWPVGPRVSHSGGRDLGGRRG
jgi:hypothetical protein